MTNSQMVQTAKSLPEPPLVCCVGGGKGGTGKSIIALNLARAAAEHGLKVVLADLDLGGANLHILTGIKRFTRSLRDFFGGRVATLSELVIPLEVRGLGLLPCGEDVAGVVQPGFQRKQKLLRHLQRLPAEVVICDLGGNSSLDTLDIFNEADLGLLVTTPEPTAVQNTYAFLKAALLRKLWRNTESGSASRAVLDRIWDPAAEVPDLNLRDLLAEVGEVEPEARALLQGIVQRTRLELLVNQASVEEGQKVHSSLAFVAQRFLEIEILSFGTVPQTDGIHEDVLRGRMPVLPGMPVSNLLNAHAKRRGQPAVGVNEEIVLHGEVLHVQTEDLGHAARAFLTLVYAGGRILFSKRIAWDSSFFDRCGTPERQERVRFMHCTVIQAIRAGRVAISLPEPRSQGKGA